jgi:hypothetical protein
VNRKYRGRESARLIRDTVSDTGMYVPDGHGHGHAAVGHLLYCSRPVLWPDTQEYHSIRIVHYSMLQKTGLRMGREQKVKF